MILAFEIRFTTKRFESVAGLALVGMFVLLVHRRSSFEEIDWYRSNELFEQSLGLLFVPAQETLCLYLEKPVCDPGTLARIRFCNGTRLKQITVSPVEVVGRKYWPVYVDVSVLDNTGSHKEGVSRTYMGPDEFALIFSYFGTEGYMRDCERCPGLQHCQKGTQEFLLPQQLSFVEGATVEPVSNALRAVARAGIREGDR